jgi:ribulose 1,5-bisphosphate carboxylase large subunit-like protein
MEDYRVDVTDLLASFRVIPNQGCRSRSSDWAESSTGTWTTVWTVGCYPRSQTGQFFTSRSNVGDETYQHAMDYL